MVMIGLENAAFWAFVIFVLNIIPTIGSMVSTLLPALFAYLQFQNYVPAVTLLAVIGFIQLVIGNVLLPKLAGDRLNLSQFVIVLALFVWSAIWGIVGMFLAVPITSMLMITFSNFETTRPWAILLSQKGRIGQA
jgi:predicted PurR-regulated permease PerM